jgi:hypothetical protein
MFRKEKKVVFRFSISCLLDQDRFGAIRSCLAHRTLSVGRCPRLPAIAGRMKIARTFSLRKEVIQPQVLLRLPCYDFTPIMNYTLGGCSLAVSAPTSSATHFRDVTGGVYKARERIHRGMLIHDY